MNKFVLKCSVDDKSRLTMPHFRLEDYGYLGPFLPLGMHWFHHTYVTIETQF